MKVKTLVIERRPSYDDYYPNMLIGTVHIEGEGGDMKVQLSNKSVGEIFRLIKSDIQERATLNASQAERAIEDAGSEELIIEHAPKKGDE